MEVDLYQRRGMFGLGDDAVPVSDQPIPAYLQNQGAPAVLDTLSSIGSGLSAPTAFGGVSWSTLALVGIGAWVILSAAGRGTKRAYGAVTAPIKRRRKRKAELSEAEESYQKRRKAIERAYSR